MADEKDTATEALMAGATKAYEDEAINGYEESTPSFLARVAAVDLKGLAEYTFNHDPTTKGAHYGTLLADDPYEPAVEHQRIITRTYTIHGNVGEVLKGLGDDLKKDVDYAHWDRCVREEAARQLEIPRNATEYLNELGRALESLDDLIEGLEAELDEEGFNFHAKFGYINMDLQRMYENLRLAEEALDSVNSQVDHRLPALLRDGTRKHALVSNPYPQHKDVGQEERQYTEDMRRLGFLIGDPGRSDADDAEMYTLIDKLRKQGRDPGWTPCPRM